MGDLEKAFRYPMSGEGWGSKLALGGFLCILGSLLGFIPWVGWIFSILLALFPLGYAYLVFRNHLRGPEGPLPAWGGWGELFIRGLSVFFISLGYWIIPVILYWMGKVLWESGAVAAFLGVLFLILGIGVGLVAFFLEYAGGDLIPTCPGVRVHTLTHSEAMSFPRKRASRTTLHASQRPHQSCTEIPFCWVPGSAP